MRMKSKPSSTILMAIAICSCAEMKMHSLELSESEKICVDSQETVIQSKEKGIDFVFGVLKSTDATLVHYYVSSEPGQLGKGTLVKSQPYDDVSLVGHRMVKNIYSDGSNSIVVQNFRSNLDGKDKVFVEYYFSPKDNDQHRLVKKLASKTRQCDLN